MTPPVQPPDLTHPTAPVPLPVQVARYRSRRCRSRRSPGNVSAGDPERGISLMKLQRVDAAGNSSELTFSPAVLYLPLEIVPGEEFNSVGIDPRTGSVLQNQAKVMKRERVDACGEVVDGWVVESTQTFSGCGPDRPAPHLPLHRRSPARRHHHQRGDPHRHRPGHHRRHPVPRPVEAGPAARPAPPAGGPEVTGARRAVLGWALSVMAIALYTQVLLPGAGGIGRGTPGAILFRGLVFGLVNALTAAGIILVYRTLRVINFAQTAIGAAGAILTFDFVQYTKVPFPIAFLLGPRRSRPSSAWSSTCRWCGASSRPPGSC